MLLDIAQLSLFTQEYTLEVLSIEGTHFIAQVAQN
jgi:hypothetical protein